MKIAALSDFHIGSDDRGDGFRHERGSFLRFLDQLESEHDRIVLVGDLFQTEHGLIPTPYARVRELHRARRRASWLWERVEAAGYLLVYGNHDAVAETELGAAERIELEADGFRAVFIHGHQFDPIFQRAAWAARASTWMTGRIRAAGLGWISDRLEYLDIAVKDRRFRGPAGPYARAAAAILERGADAVIMGHTHVMQRIELPGGVFANTGTCSLGQRMWISIDTATRTVDLRCADSAVL